MTFNYLPPVTPQEALQRTWASDIDLMYQVSCRCLKRTKEEASTGRWDTQLNVYLEVPFPFVQAGVHGPCGQPVPVVLRQLIEECDSCEQWYIIRTDPDNNYLCNWCG